MPAPRPRAVELIAPDSQLSDTALLSLYQEQRAAIREYTEEMATPAYRITDPARYAMARSFGANLLAILDGPPAPSDREALRRRVNLAYEGLLVLIDYVKWTTDAPKVPRRRTTAA